MFPFTITWRRPPQSHLIEPALASTKHTHTQTRTGCNNSSIFTAWNDYYHAFQQIMAQKNGQIPSKTHKNGVLFVAFIILLQNELPYFAVPVRSHAQKIHPHNTENIENSPKTRNSTTEKMSVQISSSVTIRKICLRWYTWRGQSMRSKMHTRICNKIYK